MTLTWRPYEDPIFGPAWRMEGLPPNTDDWSASAHRNADHTLAWAHAYINGRYLNHHAKTMPTAIKRLNKEIDKMSIGLFGEDDVVFEGCK